MWTSSVEMWIKFILVVISYKIYKYTQKKLKQWDDEDQAELIKLTTKYPRGTTERWQKIASEMGRTIQEVTSRASQAKDYMGIYYTFLLVHIFVKF